MVAVVPQRRVWDGERVVACLRRVAVMALVSMSWNLPSSRVHRGRRVWRKKGDRPVVLVTHGGGTLGSGTRRMDTTTANGFESVGVRKVW